MWNYGTFPVSSLEIQCERVPVGKQIVTYGVGIPIKRTYDLDNTIEEAYLGAYLGACFQELACLKVLRHCKFPVGMTKLPLTKEKPHMMWKQAIVSQQRTTSKLNSAADTDH